MQAARKLLMAPALLAAAFAGGALAQWTLGRTDAAHAAGRTTGKAAPGIVDAREFRLFDASGKMRASLGVGKYGTVLVMRDEKGYDVLGLGFWPGGFGLSLDPRPGPPVGQAYVNLGASTDGRYAGLGIRDEEGKRIVLLGTTKN